jgi:hypothetical protein
VAPLQPIPTLSPWALLGLGLALCALSAVFLGARARREG